MKFFSFVLITLLSLNSLSVTGQNKQIGLADKFPFTGKIELADGYPNPVESGKQFTIPYKAIHAESITITLYSVTGERLRTFSNLNEAGFLTIETSRLNPGMYVYALIVNGRLTDKKRLSVQ